MKSRIFHKIMQGWLGGLFLIASFAFIFMAFSLSAALADPVQFQNQEVIGAVSPRAQGQGSPRNNQPRTPKNALVARTPAQATAAQQSSGPADRARETAPAAATRSVATRGTGSGRTATAAAERIAGAIAPSRGVSSRATGVRSSNTSRSVVSRSASSSEQARVSLTGTAIRASTFSSIGGLGRLTSANYGNLIDTNTGMISADAYSDCVESYYTCMDEICAARSPGQRRCACAGRVKTFNAVEATLQTAKEDLLKVSGELSLLIMTKGETIRSAFELTEAEKSLNCVSFRDEKKRLGSNGSMRSWCDGHLMLDTSVCEATMNATCGNIYGFPGTAGTGWMDVLNGADSDIITSLQTYADTLNEVNTFTYSDDNNLWAAFNNVDLIVNGANSVFGTETSVDRLARTWGYDLFQYAHNNVCGRILDACFNGIYEVCGQRTADLGGGTGPYNQNSKIQVTNDGNDVEFITPRNSTTGNGTAACFGYTSAVGDPYGGMRTSVANARLSILQKYVLDSNADCDVYGDELKRRAQNMAYQKISATQLLQKKRLEFAQEKVANTAANLANAKSKFQACVSEIYDCYDQTSKQNQGWPTARVRNYCHQSANVPSCYDDMVCDREAKEIVNLPDNTNCANSKAAGENTCRNVTTLSEITNVAGITDLPSGFNPNAANGSSVAFREDCLQNTPSVFGPGSIRDFGRW